MEQSFYYIIFGIIIHVLLFYYVYQSEFLTWPDGILLASLLSLSSFFAHYFYWLVLLAFFIPSSIISKSNSERKKNLVISKKSSKRRGSQVIANSLGFMIFSTIQLFSYSILGSINPIFFLSGSVFLISAASDTWSTEIGTLSKNNPRSILNFKKIIPKGTSGGITLLGSLGGFFGSFYMSVFVTLIVLSFYQVNGFLIFNWLVILGFSGQIIDSLLGATLQKKYFCESCSFEVEDPDHQVCGSSNLKKSKFFTILDNNTVNLASNSIVSVIGFIIFSDFL